MALTFSKIEPVNFGGMKVMPKITTELKLRLEKLQFDTDDDIEEAITKLSQAFGNKKSEVEQFMRDNMFPQDLSQLKTYLVSGPQALVSMERRIDKVMSEQLEKVMSTQEAKSEA